MEENSFQSKRRKTHDTSQATNSSNLECFSESDEIVYAGRVLRLEMINFMCHSNLEVTFNPRINFITGCNGSGKSAIMAALVVVLGGTAINTGRGSGVADFIKKGETSGQVMILLLNEGINAFKPDLYGDRICIIRKFSQGGSNSYIIKSASGAVISKKKQEVDQICRMLRLEIRNPICVLNQDVARSFLTSSDSKVRYELFMNATQLRQLEKSHEDTIVNFKAAKSEMGRKNELLAETKKEINELNKKMKYLASVQKTALEKQNLENEFLWAGVVADENAVGEIKAEKLILQQKIEEFHETIRTHKSRVDALDEEARVLKLSLEKVKSKMHEIQEERRKIQSEDSRINSEISRKEAAIASSFPRLKRTLGDIERVKEYLQQIDERNKRCADEHAAVLDRINHIRNELKEVNERSVAAERDIENANETKIQARYAYTELENGVKDLERNKLHKRNQLEGLRGEDDMDILRFGPYVPRLLDEIEAKKKRFKKLPVGPLGMYIKLKCDPKWGPAIESVIGSLMTAFCCDNSQDFQVLNQIMNDVVGSKQPTIIISPFQNQRHNVSRHQVSMPDLPNILDALNISDTVVFNTIVDQAGAEGIILLERDDQAEMLAQVENVPRGLRMAVTLACDRYYPAPNYRTYAGRGVSKFFNQSRRREDVVNKLERELAEIDEELRDRNVEKQKHRETLSKMDDFAKRAEARLRDFRKIREALEIELSELKDKDESRPVPRTRLALEQELEMLEKQKEEIESERALMKAEIDKTADSGAGSRKKLEEINKKLDKVQESIEEIESQLSDNSEAKSALMFVENNASGQLERLQQQLNNNSERQVLAEEELKQRLEEAVSVCPERVATTRSLVELSQLLEKKEKYLRAAEKITGPAMETMEMYKEKKEVYRQKLEDKEKLDQDLNFFINSISNRMNLFNERLRLSAQEVSYYFRANLMTRGYDGVLQFNFEQDQLDMEVQPRANESDHRTDAKTLSGGERSYSTVSFILAMWRAVVMPFYFLDEFDVFMDRVNRKIVMDLLLQFAHEKKSTQFVFITPLDISSIVASDVVSIFKMPDPKRPTNS